MPGAKSKPVTYFNPKKPHTKEKFAGKRTARMAKRL